MHSQRLWDHPPGSHELNGKPESIEAFPDVNAKLVTVRVGITKEARQEGREHVNGSEIMYPVTRATDDETLVFQFGQRPTIYDQPSSAFNSV